MKTLSLEAARYPAHGDRHCRCRTPAAHHRQRLALGRFHLAGHDRAARPVLRDHQPPAPSAALRPASARRWRSSSAPRPGTSQRAVGRHQPVVGGQRGKRFVGRAAQGRPQRTASWPPPVRPNRMGVEPGTHRGAANGQLLQRRQGIASMTRAAWDPAAPPSPTSPARTVSGVASCRWVRPDLHDVGKLRRLGCQRRRQARSAGCSVPLTVATRRHVHRGGKHVVGRTGRDSRGRWGGSAAHAPLAAEDLRNPVGQHPFMFMLVWAPEPVCHRQRKASGDRRRAPRRPRR